MTLTAGECFEHVRLGEPSEDSVQEISRVGAETGRAVAVHCEEPVWTCSRYFEGNEGSGQCSDFHSDRSMLQDSITLQFLLDPYLSAHVEPLYAVIRERALLQYLEPFASADLNAMANVFRTDLRSVGYLKSLSFEFMIIDHFCSQLEGELVALCEKGQLSARIDAVGATIRMVLTNEREENYKK